MSGAASPTPLTCAWCGAPVFPTSQAPHSSNRAVCLLLLLMQTAQDSNVHITQLTLGKEGPVRHVLPRPAPQPPAEPLDATCSLVVVEATKCQDLSKLEYKLVKLERVLAVATGGGSSSVLEVVAIAAVAAQCADSSASEALSCFIADNASALPHLHSLAAAGCLLLVNVQGV